MEAAELKKLKAIYMQAADDCAKKIKFQTGKIDVLLNDWDDLGEKEKSILQSQIYQRKYQQALQKQISEIIDNMNNKQYATVSEYLTDCYENGFASAMYSLHKQGVPIIMPLDQKAVVKGAKLDSKVSKKLYGSYVTELKKHIRSEVSRGVATSLPYKDIARNLNMQTNIGLNKAMRIARTEGHNVQVSSSYETSQRAKEKGADVLKQWSAALDKRTRDSHRQVDGEIRELDEPFSNGMMYPSDPAGGAAEVVNCRCALLQRAKWALDEEELQTLKDRAAYYGLDKTESFDDFKKKYMKAAEATSTGVPEPTKVFKPAKTIEEAEEYVKQFVDDDIWGGTGVSYKGIGIDSANAVNEALTKLFESYDIGKLGGIIAPKGNTKLGKLIENAKAAYSPIRKSLLLNNKTFKNLKTVANDIAEEKRLIDEYLKNPDTFTFKTKRAETVMKASAVSGRATVPETVEDIINHEFGHTFEKAISQMDNYGLIKDNMPKYAEKISGYATSEFGEYIAESFASYRKGENLIDPELKKVFDKLGKKGIKESVELGKKAARSLEKFGNTGIIVSEKQFGKKVGKHAADWGLDPSKEADRNKLKEIITDIIHNRDEEFTGEWIGQKEEVRFWVKGEDVVITTKSNQYITIMKGGAKNARVKEARKQKV